MFKCTQGLTHADHPTLFFFVFFAKRQVTQFNIELISRDHYM